MQLAVVIRSVTLIWFVHYVGASFQKVSEQPLRFKAPDITDEEGHSLYIPEHLRCDACRIVAYQMYTRFRTFNERRKHYKYNIPESEIIDIVESVCGHPETYNEYGLKEVKGTNRLSGPGLETAHFPGMMAGGGRWPGRLMRVCSTLVEELGEDEIYASYRANPSNKKVLENLMCFGRGILGVCAGQKREYYMEL